jgi:hypothetical protein
VGPVGPVDDGEGVPTPLPGMTGDVHFNRRCEPPVCLVARALIMVDDVRSDEMGGVSPQRGLRLKLQCGGRRLPAIMACHI